MRRGQKKLKNKSASTLPLSIHPISGKSWRPMIRKSLPTLETFDPNTTSAKKKQGQPTACPFPGAPDNIRVVTKPDKKLTPCHLVMIAQRKHPFHNNLIRTREWIFSSLLCEEQFISMDSKKK